MMSAADAPSVSGDELPGVICHSICGNRAASSSVANDGFRPARPSDVVPARTVSSVRCSTIEPSAPVTITGTISLSKAPDEAARAASSCDRAEKSSSCARLSPHFAAMSSAETPWFTRPSG
ncbi:unannotated protein [freshwater metagenome]|uniref:Unannotated protein n=1 Tax=freshwater metagenome TaxID=449393 RepID=A0A6J6USC7_9ZZZZ